MAVHASASSPGTNSARAGTFEKVWRRVWPVLARSFSFPAWMREMLIERGTTKRSTCSASRSFNAGARHQRSFLGTMAMQWTDRIGRRLKPRDLHVFMAVVEQGNISKAAESLAISRPVVSKTIAGLEQTLGVPLLDRSPKGVEPTLYGRALLKWAVAVFDDLQQGVKEIEFLANPTAGELRIGCTEPMAGGFVPAVIDRLSRRYAQLAFQLELGSSAKLQLRSLRERKCDLVIARMLALTPEPDMDAEPLFHEQVFVTAGPRNKWLGRRNLELAELIDEPWILAPVEIEPGGPVFEAFRAIGLEVPRAKVLVFSLNLRANLMATGRYLTVAPGSVLRLGRERTSLKVLPVSLPRWSLPVAIITLKNRTLSPVAQLFIECAHELAKSMAARPQGRTP